jgi:hypothetical protein
MQIVLRYKYESLNHQGNVFKCYLMFRKNIEHRAFFWYSDYQQSVFL